MASGLSFSSAPGVCSRPARRSAAGCPSFFRGLALAAMASLVPPMGFARNSEWVIEGTNLRNDGCVEIKLALAPNEVARGLGYAGFRLRFRVTISSDLEMELEIRNDAKEPLTCEEALHTY
jgi:D-hexose-6-phosphate mutarotase